MRWKKLIYLTNRSLSVAHNDDVSHVSPLESSSSVLLNQLVFVDAFFKRADSFEDPLLPEDDDELLPPRKKPSIALPMIRASTIALRPSHFKRFKGDLCSFRFFALGFSLELAATDVDDASFESVNFSNVSLAKVTVACADDLTVLVRFDAGI